MGELIAILRKTKGLTQRDLAEMLNVSDKAVSRWERGESYPDIELIPIIANIFSITADELIRGQLNDTISTNDKKKNSCSRIRTLSLVAILLSLLGLIAAAIINNGLYRCYIAFFASLVFYISAIFVEAIAMNSTLAEENEDDLRKTILKTGLKTISLPIFCIFFSLPLLLITGNGMVALNGDSWFISGIICVLLGLIILSIASAIISKALIEKGIYPLTESEKQLYKERQRRKGNIAILFGVIILLSLITHLALTEIPYGGTKFYTHESFLEFIEKEEPRTVRQRYSPYSYSNAVPVAIEEVGEPIYYDMDGNIISKLEAKRRVIRDAKGNEILAYHHLNENVASISYNPSNDGALPIRVRTYDDLENQRIRNIWLNIAFACLYAIEILTGISIYFRKRPKNHNS